MARDGGWVVQLHLVRTFGPPKGGWIGKHHLPPRCHRNRGKVGDYKTAGPHLFRMAKKGDALTLSITKDFKGKYRADFVATIPSLKQTAPYLNRLNSNLFFGGEANFKAVRLEVDGKVIDPGIAPRSYAEYTGPQGWMKFQPGSSLPPYFDGQTGVGIGKDGLEFNGHILRTTAGDFINKDFTLDVVYRFGFDQKSPLFIGLGENGRDSGNWILNSICSRVHGPLSDGVATVTFHSFFQEPVFAKLGKDHPGPNLFRLEKRGNALLMGICADYKGRYEPDFVTVIPSLKWQTPYLNDKNSYLFVGDGSTVEQMRLIVDGKPVTSADDSVVASGTPAAPAATPNPTRPPATANPVAPPPTVAAPSPAAVLRPANIASLFQLGGAAGLPPYLHASAKSVADAQGLRGEVRTVATDLLDHNFTLDLLYIQSLEDNDFFAGIGEGQDGARVAFKATGPKHDGQAFIAVAKSNDIRIGNLGKSVSRNLLRIQKRGNTLTFSVWVNYSDGAAADFVQSIPDLKGAAPYLTRLNSALFIDGSGTAIGVNLIIDGKPAGPGTRCPRN